MKHSIIALSIVFAFSCGIAHASTVSRADNLGAKALQAQHTAAQAANFASMARDTYNHTPAANRSVAAQAAQDAQGIADKAQQDANTASHAAAVASMQQAMTNAPVASQDPAVSKAMATANIAGAVATAAAPADTMNGFTKNDPTGTPGQFTAQAVSTAPANSTINQSAASMPANTPVSVTDTKTGQTVTTTAGAIAKVNPQAQIAAPVNSVFAAAPRKGGNNHNDRSSRSEHGTGNGGNNAANSNSAHGLGGGNHIGGGSAQSGSRNVGHW